MKGVATTLFMQGMTHLCAGRMIAVPTCDSPLAQAFAAKLGTIPTTVLRLDNMVKAITLLDAQEYDEVRIGTRLLGSLPPMYACS